MIQPTPEDAWLSANDPERMFHVADLLERYDLAGAARLRAAATVRESVLTQADVDEINRVRAAERANLARFPMHTRPPAFLNAPLRAKAWPRR